MNSKITRIIFIIIFLFVMGCLTSTYYPAVKQFVVELLG